MFSMILHLKQLAVAYYQWQSVTSEDLVLTAQSMGGALPENGGEQKATTMRQLHIFQSHMSRMHGPRIVASTHLLQPLPSCAASLCCLGLCHCRSL